jgi:similar to stage IV sporulation protein
VGNQTLSRSEILTALETVGVYPGVSGLRLDNPQIRSRMQSLLPELIWCTVQVRGSRAVVVVRERRLPPERVDESLEREVAAAKAGTVESLQVLQGKAVVRRGDTVLPGDLLITGAVTDRQAELRKVHAQGRVIARTWYEKAMEIPLTVYEKTLSDAEEGRWGIKIGDLTLKMSKEGSISLDFYDKISIARQLSLLELGLPLFILREEDREYTLRERTITPAEAEALLKERLLSWLRTASPEAELLQADFRTEVTEYSTRVTMLASCREDIGVERPLTASDP